MATVKEIYLLVYIILNSRQYVHRENYVSIFSRNSNFDLLHIMHNINETSLIISKNSGEQCFRISK